MQILGKKSKLLLISVAIAMLIAVGVSFATWDNMSKVQAANGNVSPYANAKVGDVIAFGNYYQTGEKDPDDPTEYKKTPIEWIVVDKDERTGQLTLLSKYILAAGSYFGNWYYSETANGHLYNSTNSEVGGNPYNQAYVESTARAFLNNLERRDLGGDSYESKEFKTSAKPSTLEGGKLYTSVGFSNRNYYINDTPYKRPIEKEEYRNRPATRGFYDEAFSDVEKAMIVPKAIAGYTGFRWPTFNTNEPSEKTYVEGAVDKVWLPSATELNIMAVEDNYTNPSDEASSTVFEYFKGKTGTDLQNALKTTRTDFVVNDSMAMNYSIPVYKFNSTVINDDIHKTNNSTDHYWTRTPRSNYYRSVRNVGSSGSFDYWHTNRSDLGVRPALILSY